VHYPDETSAEWQNRMTDGSRRGTAAALLPRRIREVQPHAVEIPANTAVVRRDELLLEATRRFLTNIFHTDWNFTDVLYLRFAPE
jgi:hypothetical protein